MLKKISSIILVFSLALNLAFVGMWGYHRFYIHSGRGGWDEDDGRREMHGDWRGWPGAGHPESGGPRRMRLRLGRRLNLSRGQRRAFREFRRELARKMGKRMKAVRARRQELFDLLGRPEVNRGAVDDALSKLTEARGRLTRATVEHMLELKDVLAPDQQRRMLDIIRERTVGHGRVLREFVGGRGDCPRPHRGRDGGRRRRRRGAPPTKRDFRGPQSPGGTDEEG